MGVSINVTLDDAAIERLLSSPDGEVGREVRRVADRTANLARAMAPVDDGYLRASIRVETDSHPGGISATVYSTVHYAIYVHEGTGIYGPRGAPIRPRRGRYLVFEARNARTTPRGRGQLVFARQVRGQRPQRFLLNALRIASPWPVDDTVVYS